MNSNTKKGRSFIHTAHFAGLILTNLPTIIKETVRDRLKYLVFVFIAVFLLQFLTPISLTKGTLFWTGLAWALLSFAASSLYLRIRRDGYNRFKIDILALPNLIYAGFIKTRTVKTEYFTLVLVVIVGLLSGNCLRGSALLLCLLALGMVLSLSQRQGGFWVLLIGSVDADIRKRTLQESFVSGFPIKAVCAAVLGLLLAAIL